MDLTYSLVGITDYCVFFATKYRDDHLLSISLIIYFG